jgi:hypothetical protein
MMRQVDKSNYNIPISGDPRLHRELMWNATDDDAAIGVIILDVVDRDFSWVAITQNDQGQGFTSIDMGHSLPTEAEAKATLHDVMRSVNGTSSGGRRC